MPESFVSMGRGHSCLLRLLPLSRMGTEGSLAVPPSAGTVSVLRWHSGCGHRPVARAGLVPFHPRQHLRLRHGPARVAGWEPVRREMPARCDPSSAAPSRRLQSPVTFQMQQLPYRAGRLPAREEAGTARGKETTHTWTRRMGGNDPLSQHKGMLPGGTNVPPPAPRCWQDSVPLEPAPGTAGLGWGCHLDFGALRLPRLVVSGTSPSHACVAHGLCHGPDGATALPHGAGSCRHGTMLPRTSSSSINTSKRVLMAASKQEGTERQTRLLATGAGEKQLSLQAGKVCCPLSCDPVEK